MQEGLESGAVEGQGLGREVAVESGLGDAAKVRVGEANQHRHHLGARVSGHACMRGPLWELCGARFPPSPTLHWPAAMARLHSRNSPNFRNLVHWQSMHSTLLSSSTPHRPPSSPTAAAAAAAVCCAGLLPL